MYRIISGALLVCTAAIGAAGSSAAVVMCTDPVTGKKTFTDKACPDARSGKKVKVNAVNFGEGVHNANRYGTWTSDIDTSVSGRDNLEKSRKDTPHLPPSGEPASEP